MTGFTLDHQGHLAPITSSTRSLPAGVYSQVGIDTKGDALVLTHRSANELLVYALGEDGRTTATPVATPSAGTAPFSFVFTPQDGLLVAEAGSNSVLRTAGRLQPARVSAAIANGQTATCWITTAGPRFAFTANPGTSSLSSY